MEVRIPVPTTLSGKRISDFFDILRDKKDEVDTVDKVIFDFSDCKYITPAGALVVASHRDKFLDENPNLNVFIRNEKEARVTKFLQSIGVLTLEELYDDSYVKGLTDYTVKLRRCYTFDDCMEVQEEIMKQVMDRTECTDSAIASLDHMIGEIWDNAGAHGYGSYYSDSYPKPVYIAAFSYSTGVKVAVLDMGQGIHESLRKKEKYSDLGAKEALKLAIQDEVSGHPNNSPGFGLFSSSELAKSNDGELAIWSSGRSIEIDNSGTFLGRGNFYDGTLVNFTIDATVEMPFNEIVKSTDVQNYIEDYQIL